MSRGELGGPELEEINSLLPDLKPLETLVLDLDPRVLSTVYPHESSIPVASVCFGDACQTLSGVRYALHEFHAHGRWYRGLMPPNELGALYFERYYLEDAAFRLYNAGEDLADALRLMLGITKEDLRQFARGRSSLQAQIGTFLLATRPVDEVTRAVGELLDSKAWTEAMKFRSKAVHEQTPSVEGLGPRYGRQLRWRTDGERWMLPIGGGDSARWLIHDLGDTMDSATRALVTLAVSCVAAYRAMLTSGGRVVFTGASMRLVV